MTDAFLYRFIGGYGRSGTTILHEALATHPDCYGILETQVFPAAIFPALDGEIDRGRYAQVLDFCLADRRKLDDDLIAEYAASRGEIDAAVFDATAPRVERIRGAAELLFRRPSERRGKRVCVEKTPGLIRYASRLHAALEGSKFVHIHRDPRDVFSSVRDLPWGPDTAEAFVESYNELMRVALSERERIGDDYLTLHFERLVARPGAFIERAWRFFDLRVDRGPLARASERVTGSAAHVGRFARDLDAAEAERIERGCAEVYRRWLDLSLDLG